MRLHQLSFISALLLIITGFAWAQDATLINVTPENAPALVAVAKETGLTLRAGDTGAANFTGSLVVWQAKGGNGTEVTPQAATALADYVRQGGSLLLTLSDTPGTGPFRLSSILPTTAWNTQGPPSLDGVKHRGGLTVGETDDSLLPAGAGRGLTVPFYFPIHPFSTVERGEGRYDRFGRPQAYIDVQLEPGNTFWTRPLLNRDWEIRARGDDVGQTPLLLTGRYGAGRVAVFGSSIEGLPDSPVARAFWKPVLQWLTQKPAAATVGPANFSTPDTATDAAARTLKVSLKNPTATPLQVHVVARFSTWERALVGDASALATLPANGQGSVTLPLPKAGTTSYQALEFRDAFDVRLGVLSGDGRAVLNESRQSIDLSPAVGVQVATDNTRLMPYPFHAPGPEVLAFPNRMGMETDQYAYPPGSKITASVTLTNGTHNIAPLAIARDESKPDNPTAPALNDEAGFADQGISPDKVTAFGAWIGTIGQENVLSFTWPSPVTVSGVTLIGNSDNYRRWAGRNPGSAIVEVDGKEVAHADGLDARFTAEAARVRIGFTPCQGRVLRLRFPWSDFLQGSKNKRGVPCLGDVRIDGSSGALPPAAQGAVTVVLRDDFSGTVMPAGTQNITLEPGATQKLSFAVTAPNGAVGPRYYTLEASFAGQHGETPLMVIEPEHALLPAQELKPPTAPELGFIVTRGFRNAVDYGTGTDEIPPGWATPDDLIWAYAHQMKQLSAASRTQANRLYLTESDMRHYSTPWRDYPDGTYFYDTAAQSMIDKMKRDVRWKDSTLAALGHSDRWDCAPDVDSLHGWQDFIGFDEYLKSQKLPGLRGKTRSELTDEIHTKYESRWQAYQLDRYVRTIHDLRTAFAKEGKQLLITAQGSPLVPAKFEKDLTATIRGQSDDVTWAMIEESPVLSTGRQMGILAFNPGWGMSTLLQWGWDSAVLENQHWHNPVSTTEASRRNWYDRAWRGTIGWDGQYKSMHTYGYNQNGGYSYTMTDNDWQEFFRLEERHSLIAPDAPLGAGLIINTDRFADPDHAAWSGAGGWGKSAADDQVRSLERVLRALQESGVSVPFAANAGTLANWKNDAPLVLMDLCNFTDAEVASLAKLKQRGVRIVAFKGAQPLRAAAANLFGVSADGLSAGGQKVGEMDGHAMIANGTTLLIAAAADDLSVPVARAVAPILTKALDLPVIFPLGTAGYGFVSQGKKFIVIEDWREEGRIGELRIRAGLAAKAAHAVDANDHRSLEVRRDGADWVIQVPLRPGDGTLVCVEEN